MRQSHKKQEIMASEQKMTQAINQLKLPNSDKGSQRGRNSSQLCNANTTAPRTGSPTLKQPLFNWKALDEYHELCNFKIEVKKKTFF